MSQDLTMTRIFEIEVRFWEAKVLLSALELGEFTELAKSPLDLQTLTMRLDIHTRSARDFFDALVSLHLLDRQNGKYANMPDTDFFFDKNKSTYAAGFLEMASMRGQPQSEVRGSDTSFFETVYKDPVGLRVFLQGMTGLSKGGIAEALAEKFPWQKYRTFLDVGTSEGGYPVEIARTHSHLTGTGFDLPPVQPVFEEYIRGFGLQDCLHFAGGDFFKDELPHADVIIMAHILHDWNFEGKQLLLHKAYAALPIGGALIVCDFIIDDDRRENTLGLLMSLNMLIETPGGFDYTGADGLSWMKAVGFRHAYVEHLVGAEAMLVGIK